VLVDQVDYDRAMIFDLTGLPPGVYTLTGYIQDHADHIVTDSVTITVLGVEGEDESGGSEGSGSDTGVVASTGEASGGSEGTGDGAGLDAQLDDGCGCKSGRDSSRTTGPWLLALVSLLGLSRRRRS